MKKTYQLEDLDCANCAAKMERKIGKLDGVDSVEISFMAQKMTLEAPDDIFGSVLGEAVKLIAKVEPDCKVIVK
jgi:copper chaperone CopZ